MAYTKQFKFVTILINMCLQQMFADPEFRIVAPQIICKKHDDISNEELDYSVITIKPTISTTGRMTTITDLHFTWEVLWVPLPAPSQRFTLMLWNTIRTLENKLNGEQSTELVYFINNDELLGGVRYIFSVTAKNSTEEVGSTKSFSIEYEEGNQTLQDIEGHTDKFSVMLLGGQIAYADLEYILEAEVTVCSPTEDYYFSWSVFSKTSDHVINVSNIAGSRLEIPAYSLKAGSVYELLGGVRYIFSVTAKNSTEEVGSTKSFSIEYEEGNQTLQDIEGHTDKFSVMLLGGQIAYADLEYILEAEVTVCSPTEDYYFSWSVFSKTSDHVINVSNIAGSRLEIPAYSLKAGSVYEVNCEIKTNTSDDYITDVNLSFFVRQRGLQVFLNIDYLIVPINYAFTIESIVIYKDLENYVPKFEWQCSKSGTVCDFFENSVEKIYNFSLGIPDEGEYKISLTVSVLDEVATADATVKTSRAILPLLQIQPISRIVNEGREVFLVGEASNLAPSCSLTWYFASKECLESVDSINDTCHTFTHGEAVSESIILYSIEENFLYDLVDFTNKTQSRTVKANITSKTGRVRLVAECNCSIAFECETQGISYGDVNLQLNESPKINNLTVSPQSGSALDAVFRLSASASDPDGPLRYTFYCAVSNATLLLASYLDHFAVETFLPFIDGRTEVFVEVCDSFGACTISELQSVNVTPSKGDINKLIVKTQAHIRRCEITAFKHVGVSTVISLTNNQEWEQLRIFSRSLLVMLPVLRTRCALSENDYSDVMSQLVTAGVDTTTLQ